jgi:predicted nucleic acid-binding Zn ribbon protein
MRKEIMASKNTRNTKNKTNEKPKLDREKRRVRTMSYIFLGISVILILSMILSAVATY